MSKKRLFSKPASSSSGTFDKQLKESSSILFLFSYRKALKKSFIVLTLLVFSCLLLDLIKPKMWIHLKDYTQERLQRLIAPALSVMRKAEHTFSFRLPIETQNDIKEHVNKIEALQSKIQQLEIDIEELNHLKGYQDNAALSKDAITAKIIGFPGQPFKQSILLDKGTEDNININDPLVYHGTVIGRIIKTSPHFSYGLLLSDPSSKLPIIMDESKQKGIASGMGNNRIKIRYIQSQDDLEPGMTLSTSGKGGVYPPRLNIGRIESIKPDYVIARLRINPRNILFISIVRTAEIHKRLFKDEDASST
ncbi:MAG: hypothetical protein C0582_02295 [Alphaproteobacteria bacterium]|mgnify:CR=1 FL=1|nr:MAG: hypothetical protein C0582_02295 [Alphaproteobacteria bacterium]